jgi:single-stranded-DNA-specific exonuclease
VALPEVKIELAKLLEKFEPFGEANSKPKFILRDLAVASLDFLGEKKQHLRLWLKDDASPITKKFMAFGAAEKWGRGLAPGDRVDVVAELGVNYWNGTESVEARVVDLKKIKL